MTDRRPSILDTPGFEAGPADSSLNDSVDDLAFQLEQLLKQNEQLAIENQMFESFLHRNTTDWKGAVLEEEKKTKKGPLKRKGKLQPVQLLSTDQKVDIAMREAEHVRTEISKSETRGEQLRDSLSAMLEEVEMRITELKKDAYEFKRDILTAAVNPRTGKVIAERLLKYEQSKLKAKRELVRTLETRNRILVGQIKKFRQQVKEKEDLGEGLSAIDHDQLMIENKQFMDKLNERNEELKGLKQTAGNTIQMMNTFKKELQRLVSESEWLQKQIQQQTTFLDKTREQTEQVETQRQRANHINLSLKDKISATKVPAVLDYVDQKAKLYTLKKKLADKDRKCEIATMELTRAKAQLRQTTA